MYERSGSQKRVSFPSAGWRQFFHEVWAPPNGRVNFDLLYRDGALSGYGTDEVGEFSLSGKYDAATREASLFLVYNDCRCHGEGVHPPQSIRIEVTLKSGGGENPLSVVAGTALVPPSAP